MSDHANAASSFRNEDAASMTSLQAHQSCWMSHWLNGSSKQGPAVDNSSLICYNGERLDSRGWLMQSGLNVEDGLPNGKRVCNSDENIQGDFGKKIDNFPFPSPSLDKNKEKASIIGTQGDHVFCHKPMSLALAVCKVGSSRDFNSRGRDQQAMSQVGLESKDIVASRPCTYDMSNGSKPVVVFERHFSNDNFTCFSQEGCKIQKSSSVMFHEKNMQNDLCHVAESSDGVQHDSPGKKNFESYFLKKQSQNVPYSSRNVEAMRICAMVESRGDPLKISQKPQHMLFSKETCVNMSNGHQVIAEPSLGHQDENMFGGTFSMSPIIASRSRGVKIQPLRTSADGEEKQTVDNLSICKANSRDEASAETNGMQLELRKTHQKEKKLGGSFRLCYDVASHSRGVNIQPLWATTDGEDKENTGDPSTCNTCSKNEASAETDGMRVEVPKNQQILLGMETSPLTKYDNSPSTASNLSTEKASSKRPINEIPDINEEIPGIQPAVSSTVGKKSSISRVDKLDMKQLFSCNEHTLRPECTVCPEHSVDQDTGNRWIKRLKLNSSDLFGVGTKSSDVGEDSSHDKFSTLFSGVLEGNRESCDVNLQKNLGKEQIGIDQNVESPKNGLPLTSGSKKRKRSMMLDCSWIQRWCQSCMTSPPSNPEPLVICEPHSMKFGHEELVKKQFPSIDAMALMGKDGFPSCEFEKRGPVVVWNTKKYSDASAMM